MSELWALLLLAAAATYSSRLLGVLLSGRISPSSPALDWVACVAYALIAGLLARMILLPVGDLAETGLAQRLAATGVGLAAYVLTGRGILPGVIAGAAALAGLAALSPIGA